MKLLLISKILLLFFTVGLYAQNLESGMEIISAKELKKHLKYLGSDLFAGRGTGELGGELAAKYLALQFKEIGLEPIGDNNTYYQYVPLHGSKAEKSSELYVYSDGNNFRLNLEKDFLMLNTGEQTYLPLPVPLVFVGYGIIAPEYDYNDYQSIDVEGKVAVMLAGEPTSDRKNFFDGKASTVYSYPESKERLAISRGARGIIIIPNPLDHDFKPWEQLKIQYSFEDVKLAYSITNNFSVILNHKIAGILFKDSEANFKEIIKMHAENKIRSFPLKTKLSFKGEFEKRDFVSPNLVGLIRGSDKDLRDEYLIISAHYDHLGIGMPQKGDSVYNGVLDNAIGTSAVLEIAKGLKKIEGNLKRSVLFLLVTGEEKGLLGSQYYLDHPLVPLYKTIANINIDGLAFIDDFNSIIGIGNEFSTLEEFFRITAYQMNLKITDVPPQFKNWEAFNRSDQIAFAKAGIPSILTLDGPDYVSYKREEAINKIIYYNQQIYHSPFDDLNIKIDDNASKKHMEFIFRMSYDLLQSDEKPEWNEGVPFINARLRSIAEKR